MTVNAVALWLAACLAPCSALATEAASVDQGRRLFLGTEPLRGRIVGHATELPTSATRCANCHLDAGSLRPAGPPASRAAAFGPELTAESLSQARRRRGGPASRYDPTSLCRLLRTGIDPAAIVVPSAMPRYAVADRECAALWAYLNRPAR